MSYIYEVLNSVDWVKFFKLKNSLNEQLNQRTARFLKSVVLDGAVAEFSNGALDYVDEDGWDLVAADSTKIEIKSDKRVKYNSRMRVRVPVRNFHLGLGDENLNLFSYINFDVLLIIGLDCVGYVLANDLILENLGCKLQAEVEREKINWIYVDESPQETVNIDAEALVKNLVSRIVESVD